MRPTPLKHYIYLVGYTVPKFNKRHYGKLGVLWCPDERNVQCRQMVEFYAAIASQSSSKLS